MTTPALHLSADELDGLLEGITSPRATSHLATCATCQRMVALDRELVYTLSALPQQIPSLGFADAVMHQVALGPRAVAVVPASTSPRALAARRRVFVAGGLTGAAVAGGFAWAALNPADALGFASPAVQQAGQTLWLGLQGVVANTVEQPWFDAVRDTLASPTRAVPALLGAAGAYAIALLGMRRLLTGPAPHAGW